MGRDIEDIGQVIICMGIVILADLVGGDLGQGGLRILQSWQQLYAMRGSCTPYNTTAP